MRETHDRNSAEGERSEVQLFGSSEGSVTLHTSQTTQMNGLAKLSQSSSGLTPAQAVSCPGSVFHNRWQWEEAWRLFQVEAIRQRHRVALQLTEQHVFQSSFNCPNKKDVLHWCYEVCCPTRPGECQSDVCTPSQQQRGIQIRAPDLKAWIFTPQPLW